MTKICGKGLEMTSLLFIRGPYLTPYTKAWEFNQSNVHRLVVMAQCCLWCAVVRLIDLVMAF